jgi:hypothetical protein
MTGKEAHMASALPVQNEFIPYKESIPLRGIFLRDRLFQEKVDARAVLILRREQIITDPPPAGA